MTEANHYSKALKMNYTVTPGNEIITEDKVRYTFVERVLIKDFDDDTRELVHNIKKIFEGSLMPNE
jgi:hypothetical protein